MDRLECESEWFDRDGWAAPGPWRSPSLRSTSDVSGAQMFLAAVPPLAGLIVAGVKARAATAFGVRAGAGIRAGAAFAAGGASRAVFPFRGGFLLRFWWSCCLLWSCRLLAIWTVLRMLLGL